MDLCIIDTSLVGKVAAKGVHWYVAINIKRCRAVLIGTYTPQVDAEDQVYC